MHTSSTTLEGYKVKLTVEVDEEDLQAAEEATIRHLVREVRVPGFRPGKVPPRVLAQRLGKKTIRQETLRDLVPKTYDEAVEIENIDVIAAPEIDIKEGEESGKLVYEATVDIRPIVDIDGYNDIKVEVESPVATDDDIEHQIDHMREQMATLTEVKRKSKLGDVITLDMKATRDGVEVDDLTVEDFVYELGKGGLVEDADKLLTGVKVGDDVEYDAEEAPGGKAHMSFHIKLIREKVLPAVDDDFAKDVSEFDSIADLRADLATQIGQSKLFAAKQSLRENTIAELVKLLPIEAPESMVQDATGRILQGLISRVNQMGVKMNKYLQIVGQSEEDLVNEARERAVREVLADLALLAVAEKENIKVDELELDNELVKLAEQMKIQVSTAREAQGKLDDFRSGQ